MNFFSLAIRWVIFLTVRTSPVRKRKKAKVVSVKLWNAIEGLVRSQTRTQNQNHKFSREPKKHKKKKKKERKDGKNEENGAET